MICQHKIKFFSLIDVRLCLSPTQCGAEADGGKGANRQKKREQIFTTFEKQMYNRHFQNIRKEIVKVQQTKKDDKGER